MPFIGSSDWRLRPSSKFDPSPFGHQAEGTCRWAHREGRAQWAPVGVVPRPPTGTGREANRAGGAGTPGPATRRLTPNPPGNDGDRAASDGWKRSNRFRQVRRAHGCILDSARGVPDTSSYGLFELRAARRRVSGVSGNASIRRRPRSTSRHGRLRVRCDPPAYQLSRRHDT